MSYTKPIAIQHFAGHRCMALHDAVAELIDDTQDAYEALECAQSCIESKITYGDAKFTIFEADYLWDIGNDLVDALFIDGEDDEAYETMKATVRGILARIDCLYVRG